MFDFQYFVWHYMHHHNRRLYKWAHIVHHEFHSPSAWSTQYLHPWELLCVGIYNGVMPQLFGCHPMTVLGFSFWNITVSVFDHCGYDLVLDPSHWLPCFGGARKHDMHHMKPYTNFQPFFTYIDSYLGTECPGLLGGGVRPPELIAWEKEREAKQLAWFKNYPSRHIEQVANQ